MFCTFFPIHKVFLITVVDKKSKGFGNGAFIELLNATTEIYKNRTLELARRYDKLNKK
jgi:hypothetical protein